MATKSLSAKIKKSLTSQQSISDWIRSLSYAQRQRMRFFEARLLWEGQVNRHDVCSQFGVTANHFTREVSEYRQHFPNNVWYDISGRTYRPSEKFKAGFASGNPEEYLGLLKIYTQNPSSSLMAEMGIVVPCQVLEDPLTLVDQELLRTLLKANKERCGCRITYQSFSTPTPTRRIIWPHAFIWIGFRWLVRAYDKKRNAYVDFALSRINSASLDSVQLPEEAGEDQDWLGKETFDVIPNPNLSLPQQEVVAKEYGMKIGPNGYAWTVTLRRCLIPYFLYRYRLDTYPQKETVRSSPIQRIVVLDQSVVTKYEFPVD